MTQPADVFVKVELVRAELEILRQELGRPRDDRADLKVTGAAPREVLFEALGLFRKSDRFCFERTGEQSVLPQSPPPNKVQPADVMAVVDVALNRIVQVKARVGVTDKATAPKRDDSKQPSDVLGSLFAANRSINALLDQPFTPNDVYQLISLSIGYATRLCSKIDGPAIELPKFERKKRPGDVYARLWDSFGSLRKAITGSGLDMLEVGKIPFEVEQVQPSDVYDLASLLVSELVYLHGQVDGLEPPSTTDFYEVGHKAPSHVFQLAGLLENQINALATAVGKNGKALVG